MIFYLYVLEIIIIFTTMYNYKKDNDDEILYKRILYMIFIELPVFIITLIDKMCL